MTTQNSSNPFHPVTPVSVSAADVSDTSAPAMRAEAYRDFSPEESKFSKDIRKFNSMYSMPVNDSPSVVYDNRYHLSERLKQFKKILLDEISEVDEITVRLDDPGHLVSPLDVLTELADWLGDIQVFCASEMRKFGLDNDTVLSIIMASNFSKMQADGTPLFIDGKLQKGPDYWKPEPMLLRYIRAADRTAPKEK